MTRNRPIRIGFILLAATLSGAAALAHGGKDKHKEHAVKHQGTMLVQLTVANLDRAVEFYTETLGLKLESRDDSIQWARIDPGIKNVTIGLGVGTSQGSGTVSINLGVSDLDSARAALEGAGVEFLGPTIEIPGVVRLADFYDPDGNKIRLAGHSAGFGE
jgi:predicted enzyme related to lactoylglutathione lyase